MVVNLKLKQIVNEKVLIIGGYGNFGSKIAWIVEGQYRNYYCRQKSIES